MEAIKCGQCGHVVAVKLVSTNVNKGPILKHICRNDNSMFSGMQVNDKRDTCPDALRRDNAPPPINETMELPQDVPSVYYQDEEVDNQELQFLRENNALLCEILDILKAINAQLAKKEKGEVNGTTW